MSKRVEHKQAIRSAFDRAAGSYDAAAVVQRDICQRLDAFAAPHLAALSPEWLVDAGCGTGYGLALLARRFPGATRLALDFAPAMLARLPTGDHGQCLALPICGDLEALPLASDSVDLIWSSLALQWCDPALALREQSRVLRAGGVALLATLGPATLWELRDAFAQVDEAQHVIRFHPAAHWQAAAAQAGFTCLAHDNSPALARAPDLRHLLRDIKAIGAHSLGDERRRTPLGRAAWRTLERGYEIHRQPDGLLSSTYDVIYLVLQKPVAASA